MIVRKGNTKAKRVNVLRRRIAAPFNVRGTARRFIFSTSKKTEVARSPHVYYVSPMYKMGPKEWVRRLQATVHAAVSRGMGHGTAFRFDWTGKNISHLDLPAIIVFTAYGFHGRKKESGKQLFLLSRCIQKTQKPKLKFDSPFTPYREIYEEASVHGQRRPTFAEHQLSWGRDSTGLIHVYGGKKLFEVVMTKRESKEAVNRINRRLKAKGLPSLQGLKEMIRQGKEKEAFQMALQATGQKRWIFTKETTQHFVDTYLFYQEAARILTNKLAQKATKWLDKNISKNEFASGGS